MAHLSSDTVPLFLPCVFPRRSLPRVGNGGGKRQVIASGNPLDDCSSSVKRVRLTRKTRPGVIPDPGHPTLRRGKNCAPLPPKEWSEVGEPRNLFLDLGLGEVCTRGRLEPAFGGNRRRGFRLVSPAEGG